MTRSERKRFREKKRRNDVNSGFQELMTLLLEIDPEIQAEAEEKTRRGNWKGISNFTDDNALLSRVDLITRATQVLKRIHQENEERKLIIQQLLKRPSGNPQLEVSQSMVLLRGFSFLATLTCYPPQLATLAAALGQPSGSSIPGLSLSETATSRLLTRQQLLASGVAPHPYPGSQLLSSLPGMSQHLNFVSSAGAAGLMNIPSQAAHIQALLEHAASAQQQQQQHQQRDTNLLHQALQQQQAQQQQNAQLHELMRQARGKEEVHRKPDV
jgi:hypothetical protein